MNFNFLPRLRSRLSSERDTRHRLRAMVSPPRGKACCVTRMELPVARMRASDLDCCAGLQQGGPDPLGHFPTDALLDRGRGALDEVFSLLEAEPREVAHVADDLDLSVAAGDEDDVESGRRGGRLHLGRAPWREAALARAVTREDGFSAVREGAAAAVISMRIASPWNVTVTDGCRPDGFHYMP